MPHSRTIEAIYEDGVLRPLQGLQGLAEHTKVKITIESDETSHPLLQFAGILSNEEAGALQSAIASEFEKTHILHRTIKIAATRTKPDESRLPNS